MRTQKGAILLLTFIIMVTLIGVTVAFLYMLSVRTKASGYDLASSKALWLAEAGLQKAMWNLKTPVAQGGQGKNWTTTGTTENLGSGSYTMVVERWDFALASHSSSASASSENGSYTAAKAIDGSDSTYWQSGSKPTGGNPQWIKITFPRQLSINKARFYLSSASSQQRPKSYTWQVSTDDSTYTTVKTVTSNSSTDVTDTFAVSANVKYLKLNVTDVGGGSSGVIIATLEALGVKVTSTGTVSGLSRKVEQTGVITDPGYPSGAPAAFSYPMHSFGNITDFKDSTGRVNGDVSARVDVKFEQNMTITGSVIEGNELGTITPVDYAGYKGIANSIQSGGFSFTAGQTYSGIYYIEGGVTIPNNVTINGSVIAEGNITLGTSGITIDASAGYPALISGNNLTGNGLQSSTISGLIYANNNIDFNNLSNNVTFTGTIISGNNTSMTGGSSFTINHDSDLVNNPPPYFAGYDASATSTVYEQIDWNEI